MCWNEDISLNTFLFSSFVLCLIIYNNTYTIYKINELNNVWVYVFFMSFILMQLIEYFIWRNINSPLYNKIFTIMATLLLLVQPIATNMLFPVKYKILQESMLFIYLIVTIPFAIYKFMTVNIHSTVSKWHHLQWNMLVDSNNKSEANIFMAFWLFFFLFPLFYQEKKYGLIFGVLTLLVMIYNYYNDKSVGSMWCWIVNSIMLFYAGYLMLYLPFFQK
jgi:hypothetical protein